MAIAQVPVADIVWFCVIAVGAFVILQNINYLLIIASKLWSMLPPNDVIARYVATGAIAVFSIYVINHTIIQRKPINLETTIKDNRYFEINKYTVSAFCISFVLAGIYCAYTDDGTSGTSGTSGKFAALFAQAKRGVDLMQFAIFAFIIYGLVQMYYVLLWGITPTPLFRA